MKKSLFLSLLLPAVLLSCSTGGDSSGVNPSTGKGSIVVSAEKDSGTKPGENPVFTRAEETDNYWITITGPNNYSKEDFLSNMTSIENLPAGSYTATAISKPDYVLPKMNETVYKGTKTKTLLENPQRTVFDIKCTQINTGIKFIFDPSITTYYSDIKAILEDAVVPAKTLTYLPTDQTAGNVAYFEAPSTLKLRLKNVDANVPIGGAAYQEINIAPRELWTITLKTSNKIPGSVDFVVTVDKDVTEKETEYGAGDVLGDGTLMNPYSVTDAINTLPKNEVWLQGVIVGSTSISRAAPDNILIGKEPGATAEESIVFDLTENPEIQAAIDLESHPELIGQTITIKGDIAGKSDSYTSNAFAVLSNVTNYEIFQGTGLDPIAPSGKVLKDAPFKVGFAIQSYLLDAVPAYTRTVKREASSVTAEYVMKPTAIWKGRKNYDFTAADEFVKFANDNNIRVHGHTLIWHVEIPQWLLSFNGTQEQWTELMKEYITDVITHFNGKVASWDVVNEAYGNDGQLRSTTENIWRRHVGDDFIRIAYETAREAAAPGTTLFYNDFGNEGNATKHNAILAMVQAVNTGETLIDGIGMQTHVEMWDAQFNTANYENAYSTAAAIVDYVHISELDIRANVVNDGVQTELWPYMAEAQAEAYKSIFQYYINAVPPAKRFGITMWGVDDGNSWLKNDPGYPVDWPLMFDASFSPKPAYSSVIEWIAAP